MSQANNRTNLERLDQKEREGREEMLDETIEESFPASDPPSSLPNPKLVSEEQERPQ